MNFQKKVVFVKDPNVHYVHSTAQNEDAKVDGNNLTKKLDFSADTEFWGWASPPEAVSPSLGGALISDTPTSVGYYSVGRNGNGNTCGKKKPSYWCLVM